MEKNIAFIDGQNLYMGAQSSDQVWKIDFFRFRKYLAEKYSVNQAYYYIGYVKDENKSLYEKIQKAGFILLFREHHMSMKGNKKGNVDSDIIFDVMKKLYKNNISHGVILVSGDGDFRQLVDFLIEENHFKKILFPNRKYASSLYKKISRKYFDHLDHPSIIKKISIQKKREP
jgi:uncharacterized LabA/DUF88 family protein